MSKTRKWKILLIAPWFDRGVAGESWSTYKWVEGISAACEVTVLSCHAHGWDEARSPVGAARVINWSEPRIPGMGGRIGWELKPGYLYFYHQARRWIRAAIERGEQFDLVHQINPLALRYPCPARGLGLKWLIGPLAGSLPTPAGFEEEARERKWFRKLRGVDRFRLRHDPWLKGSYAGAAAVIGVAPYVKELLSDCKPRRFELMAETGVEVVASEPVKPPAPGQPLRLLFVGRIIRTKGILDAIRAMAIVPGHPAVRLDVLGDGDLLETCRNEAAALGLGERVSFHGRVSRAEVFEWYRRSHVFVFPSFREPSGNVVFEAMSHGLPVIASTLGGPGFVVDGSCGAKVEPVSAQAYPAAIAAQISLLAADQQRIGKLSAGALRRMRAEALWPGKIERMLGLYDELIGEWPVAVGNLEPEEIGENA